ncbi:Tn3 family transposase [Photorhabdus africana]|uniref:Tn3 family transposase n=1 Tax=Photorhabdus africana TaxID=3097554 RepID=UPI002B416267|nr:Tn3 family transposase [Photorhabdus sp. CRI-LC]
MHEERIVEEWPNIQHIMTSLGQKETTQSSIVRKLSSYARQNKTKKAIAHVNGGKMNVKSENEQHIPYGFQDASRRQGSESPGA